MIRCNLTDEELRLGDHGVLELSAGDMAEELLAYRAASASAVSAGRIQEVVRGIADQYLDYVLDSIVVDVIAARAAEQLAGVAVGLTDDDRRALQFTLGVMSGHNPQQHEMGSRAAALLDRLLASPPAVHACNVEPFSSRACERGTKSCTTEHRPAVDYLAGILTILASDLPGEAMRKALEELVGLR